MMRALHTSILAASILSAPPAMSSQQTSVVMGKPQPGYLRVMVGGVEVTALSGGTMVLTPDMLTGNHMAPIPGTKHVARLEEDLAADNLELSREQVSRLDSITLAMGVQHSAAGIIGCVWGWNGPRSA